jgi:hypothetical protein
MSECGQLLAGRTSAQRRPQCQPGDLSAVPSSEVTPPANEEPASTTARSGREATQRGESCRITFNREALPCAWSCSESDHLEL